MGRKLISFDWAIKRILRSKANFGILEGFLSVLLNIDVTIIEILESESNKEYAADKSNRVDIKVKDSDGTIIIIEIQFTREYDYLNRMLYGTSKVVVEHLDEGDLYLQVPRVVSINIVYMNLGLGDDYVYHGTTSFKGIHTHTVLSLSEKEQQVLQADTIDSLYPEYYIIDVSNFNNLAKDSLDEWIYFLKNEEIQEDFSAPGLQEAQKTLDILKMSSADRHAYDDYIDFRRREISRYKTGHFEGHAEGLEKGIEIGVEIGVEKGVLEERARQEEIRRKEKEEQERILIQKSLDAGLPIELISKIYGISEAEVLIVRDGLEK